MYTRLQRSFQNQDLLQRILSNICSESVNPILNEAGMCLLTKRKRCETMFVAVMYSFSIMQCRQRYIPLVSRCCQRGGEARLSRRAHNPQSGFHFCKLHVAVSSNQPLATTFFSNRNFVFSMPYLCNGFVRCLCALGVGMYNPVLILRSWDTRIFFVLWSLCLHLSH
jgi:hypothetical protein